MPIGRGLLRLTCAETVGRLVDFFVGEASPAWFQGQFRVEHGVYPFALGKRGSSLLLALFFHAPPSDGGKEALEASASVVKLPHSSSLQLEKKRRPKRGNQMGDEDGDGMALIAIKTVY